MDKIIKDDEIDLVALFKTIWAGRNIIYYSVAICFVIGLIIAYTSPKKYTASATLIPSSEEKSSSLGGLSSLAGLAGVNLSGMMGSASGIPSELYPQVVGSVPYLMDLIHTPLTWEKYEKPMSVLQIVEEKKRNHHESLFLKYTLKLPWTIKDAIVGDKDVVKNSIALSDSVGFIDLKPEESSALGMLRGAIMVEVDKKSSLINLTVEMSEPLLSAQLADKAINLLQKHVIAYKTKQSVEKLEFVEGRYEEIKKEYELNRVQLLNYKDSHRNMVDERSDLEYQRLIDAYDMSSSIYKGLAQQLEQAKITVKEETPVFTVLEPVLIPQSPSAPRKKIIILLSFFLGGLLGIFICFFKRLFLKS